MLHEILQKRTVTYHAELIDILKMLKQLGMICFSFGDVAAMPRTIHVVTI